MSARPTFAHVVKKQRGVGTLVLQSVPSATFFFFFFFCSCSRHRLKFQIQHSVLSITYRYRELVSLYLIKREMKRGTKKTTTITAQQHITLALEDWSVLKVTATIYHLFFLYSRFIFNDKIKQFIFSQILLRTNTAMKG